MKIKLQNFNGTDSISTKLEVDPVSIWLSWW